MVTFNEATGDLLAVVSVESIRELHPEVSDDEEIPFIRPRRSDVHKPN